LHSLIKNNSEPKIVKKLNLDKILYVISPEIKSLDFQILQNIKTDLPLLNNVAEHILNSGGKRLRPALVILGAEMFAGVDEKVMQAAQIIEYLHTATLLHDDVVDGSETRRKKLTACRIWGNETSVLSGDYMFAMAFHKLTKLRNLEVMALISDTTTRMARGELLQLTSPFQNSNKNDYLKIIINKTACLFAAAIKTGALLAGADKKSANQLYEYGMKLGIAFQIVDDALDYSDEMKTGKSVGNDLQERKFTLPLSLLMEKANNSDRIRLNYILSLRKIEKTHIFEVINLMKRYGSIEYTLEVSKKYSNEAKRITELLPVSNFTKTLKNIADFVVSGQI